MLADPQAAAGFDCSGFVYWVWHNGDRAAEAAINMPDGRTTYTMNVGTKGVKVPWKQAVAGDLVFFGSGPADVTHVGLYVGSGLMIDAPHTGAVVRADPASGPTVVGVTRPG